MHIETADYVSMSAEPTVLAPPRSACRLVSMPANRTLATGPSFGASEALDAGLCTLVGQIVDIPAVLPLRHALVVMASFVLPSDPVRIADEERPHLLFLTKRDHLPGRLVAQITHTPLDAASHRALGPLQLPPPARVLLTPRLFFGQLPVPPIALSFETANAAPRDNQRFASIRRHRCQVNLS